MRKLNEKVYKINLFIFSEKVKKEKTIYG